jgi:hypothetical protein
MKFIITESRLQGVFNSYIKSEHPHLSNLVKSPLIGEEDNEIYGYEFLEPEDQILLYFQYFIKDYNYDYLYDEKELEGFPKLVPTIRLMRELNGMFGNQSYDLFKNWFEETYKLPVKEVERRMFERYP